MRSTFAVSLLSAVATRVQGVDLDAYRVQPATGYTKSSDITTAEESHPRQRGTDYVEAAKAFVETVAPNITFRLVEDHYVGTNGIAHVYFKQTANGVDIDNAAVNVNLRSDGTVLSYGNSIHNGDIPKDLVSKSINAVEALEVVRSILELPVSVHGETTSEEDDGRVIIKGIQGAKEDPEAELIYFAKPDGELALTWKVKTRVQDTSFTSYVDAANDNAGLVGVLDHMSHATYQVYPFGLNDPREGDRKIVTDPQHPVASKSGWHGTGWEAINTMGNNCQAGAVFQDGLVHSPRNDTLDFQYPYEAETGTVNDNLDAAVTQIFYTVNMLHDLYYLLGFTPAAGNFQDDNHDEGGYGRDRVYIILRYWGERNNGFFEQKPDGSSPGLTMLLFDFTDPVRDGAFDIGFVIHEYTHGLSGRLTGGPLTTGCLDAWEADGMSEGWSDLFAAALTIKPEETRENATYGFAAWATNSTDPPTARRVMYSTNTEINDWTYSKIDALTRVHEVGTVWATMLYEILWNLIDKHGKNDSPHPDFVDGVPTDGKYLMLKLLTDAFAIQPCNPTFIQARDAILDADLVLTGGENACEIWTGFAKRGLGENAITSVPRVDNFQLPAGVC